MPRNGGLRRPHVMEQGTDSGQRPMPWVHTNSSRGCAFKGHCQHAGPFVRRAPHRIDTPAARIGQQDLVHHVFRIDVFHRLHPGHRARHVRLPAPDLEGATGKI